MATTTVRRPSGSILSASHRSASPTRVKLAGTTRSPGPSVSVFTSSPAAGSRRRRCMCSPTNHPGSFRCSLHKAGAMARNPCHKPTSPPSPPSPPAAVSRLGARRPAMGSSLVRIGAVEGGEWARRALAATARPSPSTQRRRVGGFRPRASRLSVMSVSGERSGDNEL